MFFATVSTLLLTCQLWLAAQATASLPPARGSWCCTVALLHLTLLHLLPTDASDLPPGRQLIACCSKAPSRRGRRCAVAATSCDPCPAATISRGALLPCNQQLHAALVLNCLPLTASVPAVPDLEEAGPNQGAGAAVCEDEPGAAVAAASAARRMCGPFDALGGCSRKCNL